MSMSAEKFFYVCAAALVALSVSCSDDGGSGSPDANTSEGDGQDVLVTDTSDSGDDTSSDTAEDLADAEPDAAEDSVSDTVSDTASDAVSDTESDTIDAVVDTNETEDVSTPSPLAVFETIPAADSTVAPTVNSVVVRFDQRVNVDPTNDVPIVVQARRLPDGGVEDLTFDRLRIGSGPNPSFDFTAIEIERFSGSFGTGDPWEISISGFASIPDRVIMDPYSFQFTVANPCGDGTCSAGESKCNCPADCGTCSGCCQFQGGNNSVCLDGTANNACGRNGQSCGVCLSPDQCINGEGCG